MTIIEAKRIVALGKKNDIKVQNKVDDEVPNQRLVVINGFYYDDASIAAGDIINHDY